MNSSELSILQFTRSPAAPRIKTRLASRLNAEQRSELHCLMTRHICATAVAAELGPVRLWVDGPEDHPFLDKLTREFGVQRYLQQGDDLGARMQIAARQTLQHFSGVLLIGSDCPFLNVDYLRHAASRLASHDAVIGPATDGGYVLLGLRRLSSTLFDDLPWGGDQVLALTEQCLNSLGWRYELLEPLADIDRPDDLALLAKPGLPDYLKRFSQTCKAPTDSE